MKKKMITALCALTLTLGTAGSCFAAETNPQTTQAYINVPATAIDFSVTEEIIFDGTAKTWRECEENQHHGGWQP